MSIKLCSPIFGQPVGAVITRSADEEEWCLANGYAKRDADTTPTSYTGPGVANTGVTDVVPDKELTLNTNREAPYWPQTPGDVNFAYDFDPDGRDAADTEAADVKGALVPARGSTAGGTRVRIYGDNLEGVTAVSFGGVAATSLDVTADESGGYIECTTGAHAAGAVSVVLTDASGNDTVANGFLYVA